MKKKATAVVIGFLLISSYLLGRWQAANRTTAATAHHRVLYWVDPMHPAYKSDRPGIAPDCGMALQPVYADDLSKMVESASQAALPAGAVAIDSVMRQNLGILVIKAEKNGLPHMVRVPGRVVPDEKLVYRIDSGTDGFIRETYQDSVGTLVRKDQKLATCYGPEYSAIASGLLAASAGVPGANGKDGSHTMPFPGAVSKQGVSSLQGYTDRLRNLGMSDVQIKQMTEDRQLPQSVDIVAPTDGLILARNITPGQHFDRSVEFYRIANLSRIWIMADISGIEAQNIRAGTAARITLPGQRRSFSARVSDVLPEVDPATRILKLRLEADNPGLALRPDMFVDVDLPVSIPAALSLPTDAVIDSGREQRVFVERADGVLEPRRVQTGWHFGDQVEIVQGLAEGDRVVAEGTFLVDSESRLKSSEAVEQRDFTSKTTPPSSTQPQLEAHVPQRPSQGKPQER